MWLTCLGIRSEKERDRLINICLDIEEKDPSFGWSCVKSYLPEFTHILTLTSPDKDTAHKRGTWFIHKAKATGYYWTKEVKAKI